MSARVTAAALLPALILCSSPAWAAPDPSTEVAPPREIDTPADRFGFIEGEQLQVSSGTDDDNLTFRVGLPVGPSMANRFSLTVATPLHGADDQMPASLDALANGTRATLSWGYFDLKVGRPDQIAMRLRQRAMRICRVREPGEVRCRNSAYAMNKYDKKNADMEQRHSGPGATDFGIDATVGFNDFEWIDTASLLPQKARRTDWSVAGHIAHYLAGSHTALTASVSYQRAFEAAGETEICSPIDPAAPCVTASPSAPVRNENFLLSAGLRHRFLLADGKLANLAVAPLVTYDAIDDVFGVDVPVYFVPDAKGGLTGGIRFGYRSDREDKFSIGVFAGVAFNVLGR